ncbi:protein of unknown function [Methylocaldum szegediense]|jgi:hypothetical protein|uniref:Transposase n=1 Tax=Methylocaldum szegediense TaxID=73780 RepID=A0ABM9HXV2_9GAMM|nr:protein of unknown function [Methylocaldum szegediense]
MVPRTVKKAEPNNGITDRSRRPYHSIKMAIEICAGGGITLRQVYDRPFDKLRANGQR